MHHGEHYQAIASHMELYRLSNQRMAAMADLRPEMVVLDLASGSGLTALAALDHVPGGLKLYLLDRSPSMIAEARRQLGDRAAGYFTAEAEEVAEVMPEKADRVLCNMSLWYFPDPIRVLQQVRRVLKPTGRLLLSMTGTFFNAGDGVVSPQWAFMRALHEHCRIARPIPEVERLPNRRSLEGSLNGAGFKPFAFALQEIPSASPETEPGGELHNLLRLFPVPELGEPAESLRWLSELQPEIDQWSPRWRVAHFAAQPAISPEEALMAHFARQGAGEGRGTGVS